MRDPSGVPMLHRMVTDWSTAGAESYRHAMPPPDAIQAGARQIEVVIRVTPIGWTVWVTDLRRIAAMGVETGDEGRRLADAAAVRLGWILP